MNVLQCDLNPYKCYVTSQLPTFCDDTCSDSEKHADSNILSPLTFAAEAVSRVAGEACAVKAAQSVGAVRENVARSVLALIFICKMKL
jgi:hypothetical protein